jgi:hypothetical protein
VGVRQLAVLCGHFRLLVYFPYNNFAYHHKFWIMGLLFQIWWFSPTTTIKTARLKM